MEMGGEKPNAKISRMAGDLHLPEPIIHRIQYFLNAREAARTAILSKSWGSAWLTRPNIDLDEASYNNRNPDAVDFPVFVKKTIRRYEESKFKIDTFSLHMCGSPFDPNEMIVKALEMGATHLVLATAFDHMFFILWDDVFAAENIVRLSIEGFKIDLGPHSIVRCLRLESLALKSVGVKRNANSISYIISRCHLIKDLSLTYIHEDQDEYDEQGNIFVDYEYGRMPRNNCSRSLGPLELPKLQNITRLVISCVTFDILFLGDLSSLFPSLKDLTLKHSILPEHIRVSSHSLEELSLTVLHQMKIDFDIPSIRKFMFDGPVIQSPTFEPTSKEWESHVSIICHEVISTSWFLEMRNLVSQLSPSKLHLSCCVYCDESFDYEVEDLQDSPKHQLENLIMETQGLPKVQVENLFMDTRGLTSVSCYALYEGLFRFCRPKFITQNLLPVLSHECETSNTFLCKTFVQQMNERCSVQTHGMHSLHDLKQVNVQIFDEETNNYFLCKTLVQQMNEKFSFESLGLYSLNDLKEVNAQVFDEVVAEWQDIPLKSLLVASASPQEKLKIRFGLEWIA